MELIQIIITSLKLFVLLAAIVVLISYFIYKVKDRKRRKPYLDSPVYNLINQSQQVNEDQIENKNARFQVLNFETDSAADEIILKKKDIRNRFSDNMIKYKQPPLKEFSNIYDRYSNSNFEPMHKIKS